MLAMCVPYPQRLDTAGYQTIIKDDDPESPVRTKTSLQTREAHPSGSRVVKSRWPPLPAPDSVLCQAACNDSFPHHLSKFALYSMSTWTQSPACASCALRWLGSTEAHHTDCAQTSVFLIVTTTQRSQPRDQRQNQRFIALHPRVHTPP